MNLGIFLLPGDSFKNMKQYGQDVRFKSIYLEAYSKKFDKVYVFSYAKESVKGLPKNVIVVPNDTKIHRLIYGFFIPLIHYRIMKNCDILRGFGLASAISSILTRKKFIFNWAYNYINFAIIEGKPHYIPFYYFLEKIAFYKAIKVFIATKNKYLLHFPDKKFIYLPNGVDTKLFKYTSHKKGILFIGRFEKQKNLFFLLKAIGNLPKRTRRLTMVGRGSLENELCKYARLLNIKLKIISPIKNSDLPQIMKRYDILVLTSRDEGSTKVLLEAMASGMVPLVTSFSTAREIVRNNQDGFISDFNTEKFTSILMHLLVKRELTMKIGLNASKKVRKNYDMEKLIDKEIGVLKNA